MNAVKRPSGGYFSQPASERVSAETEPSPVKFFLPEWPRTSNSHLPVIQVVRTWAPFHLRRHLNKIVVAHGLPSGHSA
jgi:hypothetical protein